MPKKSNLNKGKKKIKLQDMSAKERDKIKDVGERLKVAKAQEKSRGRVITAEQLAKEEAKKKEAPVKGVGVKVKVRPVGSTQQKTQEQPQQKSGSTQGVKLKEQYQGKFGKKMTREEVQEKYFKPTLAPKREQLRILTEKANKMYNEQRTTTELSRAALEAERTLNAEGKRHFMETFEPFNADQKSTKGLNREFSRVMAFLTDYTSGIEGGMAENEHAKGLFGGQWRKQGYAGYDEEHVKKEDADMVFDIYHRLLEQQGGWQRVVGYFKAVNPGIIDYGSENIINAIYDMVQNKDEIWTPEGMDVEGAILARAVDMVENMVDSYMKISMLQRSGKDYGNIEEDPEDAERRRRVYEWQLSREKYKQEVQNGENRV